MFKMFVAAYSKVGRDFTFSDYKPQYPRDLEYLIKHYTYEIWIDLNSKSIWGKISLDVVKYKEPTDYIRLDAVAMNIKRVYDDSGDLNYDYDGSILTIYLRNPLSESPTRVYIEYSTKEPQYGLYFIESGNGEVELVYSQGETEWHRYWLPIYDYPNMKFTSEAIIHVKRGYTAISNGRLVEHKFDGDWEVWHYKCDYPHSSYLIAIAVGKFKIFRDEVDGIKLEYIVPEDLAEYVDNTFQNTKDAIKFFSEWLGVKYPYDVYRQVVVKRFVVGGMENITTTILTEHVMLDKHARLDFESEGLISHELSHQWFGDLVTCRDWSHIWINESFATFLDSLYYRHWKGMDEFIYRMYQNLQAYLKEYKDYYSRPIVYRVYKYPEEMFDRHSYPKGALVINTLLNLLGEDLFRSIVREFLTRYKFRNADTEDFRKVAEEVSGRNLEWFFDQYLYNAGHPVVKVSKSYDPKEKLLKISLKQMQGDDSPEVYKLPIEIVILREDGTEVKYNIWLDEREKTIIIPMDSKPKHVYIDPLFKVFMVLDVDYPLEDKISILKESKYVYWRILMASSLGREVSTKAADALAKAVEKDSFYGVSIEAAKSLGGMKIEYAKRKLLELLDKVKEPRVKREVINALGNYKGSDIGDKLIKILSDDAEAYSVRAAAATILGKIKDKRALKVLKKYIDVKSHAYIITRGVLSGLAEYGSDEAFEIIKKYLDIRKPDVVRIAATSLLGKFPEKKEVYKLLSELAADKEVKVRNAVVLACRELMSSEAIPILESIISRERMGWGYKGARLTVKKIREHMERGVEYKKLREEIEKAVEETRRIVERVEKLEAKGLA